MPSGPLTANQTVPTGLSALPPPGPATPLVAQSALASMNAVASRALADGVQALRPLYAGLPPAMREKALAMVEEFDAASVVATSAFLASGAQPFGSDSDLADLRMPTLLVRGDDAMHPAEVSDLYAARVPDCTVVPASTHEIAAAIGAFCARCATHTD